MSRGLKRAAKRDFTWALLGHKQPETPTVMQEQLNINQIQAYCFLVTVGSHVWITHTVCDHFFWGPKHFYNRTNKA